MSSIYRKELYIYFSSPIFYTIAFIFVCITGCFFYNNLAYLSVVATRIAQYQVSTGFGLSEIVLRPLFGDMCIFTLLIIPIISMRLYAEEKAQGTIVLVFTYPLKDVQVLLGKFLAGLSVFVLILGITLTFMIILGFITSPDWGLILSSYLGLFLMGGAFLSLGIFASSLTKNQIIAAAASFGMILIFWVIGWFSSTIPGTGLGNILEELSLVGHLDGFLKGMINLKDVIFYIFFSSFFLFVTLRVLDSHTWRG